MKKLLALLVVATVVPSLMGCGCCRRVRDVLCRGAYCGGAAPIAAPLAVPPMMVAPPVAYDPGCGYGGGIVDAGCGYNPGIQTYGYGGGVPFDSGFNSGCTSCGTGGGYELPSYGGFDSGGYSDPGYSSGLGTSTIDPGPAPTN